MQDGCENTYEIAVGASNGSNNEQPKPDARLASKRSYIDLLLKLTAILSMPLVVIFLAMMAMSFHHQNEGLNAYRKTVESLENRMRDFHHEMKADLSAQKNFSTRHANEIKDIKSITKAGQVYSRRISELTRSLSEAMEEIQRLKNATDVCPLRYDGKCFWAEIASNAAVRCYEADQVCRTRGGKAANIYSELHHRMVMGYLRMMTGQSGRWISAWLGMTYSQQNNQVLLSDGTAAPFLSWHPGYPIKNHGSCMAVHVEADIGAQNQNMHNYNKTTRTRHGVVCEK